VGVVGDYYFSSLTRTLGIMYLMNKSESRELIIRKEKAKRNLALTVGGLLLASEMILIAFNLAPIRLCILLSIPTVALGYLAMRFHTIANSPSEIDSLLAPAQKSLFSGVRQPSIASE
jgi:hypothetical protein